MAAWQGDEIVGTGRLHILSADEVQVRGMAVVPSHANNGIGSLILRELERRATRFGAKRIVLHAREAALDFYRKNHYQLGDRSYTLFGTIVHWRMYKEL